MRSRAVRVTLTLLAVAALGAAAWFTWTIDRRERGRHETARTLSDALVRAQRDVFELRAAQQAYVAAGQSETYWFDKVTALSESLRKELGDLAGTAPSAAVSAPLGEVTTALQRFEAADRRARSYAATGQKLLASDIIFGDGIEATAGLAKGLDAALHEARRTDAASAATARREQLQYIGAGVAALLVGLLMLTPAPRIAAASGEEASEPARSEPAGLDLKLRPDSNPVAPARAPVAPSPAKPVAARPAATPAPSAAQVPSVEIQALASVCTDLAKLADTDTLPGILERTATALDASGLVLWVADFEGAELVPVATHGYPASVLSRLGTITRDTANATGAAFRTGLVQTVAASATASGAIAAPLVTPSGCRGVLSAEVRGGGEQQAARLAAAAIIAAQLSALVGPPPAAAPEQREAAL
jgi:hypothetical protein